MPRAKTKTGLTPVIPATEEAKKVAVEPAVIKTKRQLEIGENLMTLLVLIVICLACCYCHKVDSDKETPPAAANTIEVH